MKDSELLQTLDALRSQTAETEIVEFKEAKNGFDFPRLGKYFSALSNEANLKGKPFAWLVFGVEDTRHEIVGSNYRPRRKDLNSLMREVAEKTINRITFMDIFEVNGFPEGRVIMFQIPAAPRGLPVSFDGHYYGREGESLVPLNLEEIERLRSQAVTSDWSMGVVDDATLDDLDETAIAKARENFKIKFPEKTAEVDGWDNIAFLNKARITIKGKITRAAILLLGKEESEHYLVSADAKIRWVLRTLDNQNKDYEIFSIPFLLAVDKVFGKIRNLKYRYLPDGTLFPNEVLRYEPFVIRESLNNAIAHQDYTKGGRINVIEVEDDHLIFSNLGSFIPGSVEKVIDSNAPEEHYRNKFLAMAMFNLNLVDTIGSGIIKMFHAQKNKFFPLPDYDVSNGKVTVTIIGKILDMEYARLLAQNPDLSLDDIMMLDKVQKKKTIAEDDIRYLRKRKFIEGRKNNYYLSYRVVKPTEDEALISEYVANKSFDDGYFKKLILEYIDKQGKTRRKAIDNFIMPKLSAVLSEKQKKEKVRNFLSSLRIKGKIICTSYGIWEVKS
ncbi:MAG: putative DNA binding domain-containing protein [Kiritimatiellaeota bacterium]|nr:putative DNA binding domain-containing protein [Kiritimatiellota bacterium]